MLSSTDECHVRRSVPDRTLGTCASTFIIAAHRFAVRDIFPSVVAQLLFVKGPAVVPTLGVGPFSRRICEAGGTICVYSACLVVFGCFFYIGVISYGAEP